MSPHILFGLTGPDPEGFDLSSMGERLSISPSPRLPLDRIADEDEIAARIIGLEKLRSPVEKDAPDHGQNSMKTETQDIMTEADSAPHQALLLENKTLRDSMAEIEKNLKHAEETNEAQSREIDHHRRNTEVAEDNLLRCQNEIKELKGSKTAIKKELEQSQEDMKHLEKEYEKLKPLEDLQEKLHMAQERANTSGTELRENRGKINDLNRKLAEISKTKQTLEEELQKSESGRKQLVHQIQQTMKWLEKVEEQFIKRDMDQFRLFDGHFLRFMGEKQARRAPTSTQGEHPENLGDIWPSRPVSRDDQSLVSFRHHGSVSAGSVLSNSDASLLSYRGVDNESSHLPLSNDSARQQRNSTRTTLLRKFQSILPQVTPASASLRTPNSRIRSQSESYVPRRPSLLRNSLAATEFDQDQPTPINASLASPSLLNLSDTSEERPKINRSFSTPVTEVEREVLVKCLESSAPLPIIWDTAKNQAVFVPEPATVSDQSQVLPTEQMESTVSTEQQLLSGSPYPSFDSTRTRRNTLTKRPAPIITQLNPPSSRHSSRGLLLEQVSQRLPPSVEEVGLRAPTTLPAMSSQNAGESMAISSSVDSPASPKVASPGLRKRHGGTSSVAVAGTSGHAKDTSISTANSPLTDSYPPKDASEFSPTILSWAGESQEVGSVASSIEQISPPRYSSDDDLESMSRSRQRSSKGFLPFASTPADFGRHTQQNYDWPTSAKVILVEAPYTQDVKDNSGRTTPTEQKFDSPGADRPGTAHEWFTSADKVLQSDHEPKSRASEFWPLPLKGMLLWMSVAFCLGILVTVLSNLSLCGRVAPWIPAAAVLPVSPYVSKQATATTTATTTQTQIHTRWEVLTKTKTETPAVTTTTKTQYETQYETEIAVETSLSTSITTRTLVETVTELQVARRTDKDSGSLASMRPNQVPILPPTRSSSMHHAPSLMFHNPSVGDFPPPRPVPRPLPNSHPSVIEAGIYRTFEFMESSSCVCPSQRRQRKVPALTPAQIDARSERARRKSAQLQNPRAFAGPSYWGFVPEVQYILDLFQYKLEEMLLGEVWGERIY